MYVQLDDVPSDFVELRVCLSTEELTEDERVYLELYLEAAFTLAVRRPSDGGQVEEVGWQTVVQDLQQELVNYGNSLGFGGGNFSCGAFSQIVILSFKAQGTVAAYRRAVELMRQVTCHKDIHLY